MNRESTLLVESSEGVAWMRMNRPESLNAINGEMVAEMNAALDKFEDDRSIRVIVLTGTGKAFCSGADLKASRERDQLGDTDGTAVFLRSLRVLTERMAQFPVPILAAVNGTTAAGGLELMLCCDLAVAARSARIGDAHANYGLLPGGGGSVRLPRRIGVQRAKYMMYTGELLDSQTLCDWGLLIEAVDDKLLESRVEQIAAKIGAKSPLGLRRMKQLVDDGMEQSMASAIRAELAMCALHGHSYDKKEGLAAFNEKRKPTFEGH